MRIDVNIYFYYFQIVFIPRKALGEKEKKLNHYFCRQCTQDGQPHGIVCLQAVRQLSHPRSSLIVSPVRYVRS